MCDLRATLNNMEHRYRFDSDVLAERLRSGLSDALARFEEDEMVGIVRFTTDDCVRSTLCQRALKAYY